MNTEKIVARIMSEMTNVLTKSQLDDLYVSLVMNIKSKEKDYEVANYDDKNMYFIEQYYASLVVEGKSERTIKRYIEQIKQVMDWLQKPILEVTTEDLRFYLVKYQRQRKVTNTTLDGMRKCICAFFNWLEYNDYIVKSPTRRLKQIKHDTVPERELNQEEIEKSVVYAKCERDKAIITLMYDCAARVDEVAKIKLSDIDFKEKTVILHGKGGKDRVSLFTDKAFFYLKEYLKNRDIENYNQGLFINKRNCDNSISSSQIRNIVREIGYMANIEHLHPHRFRVTRITNLINRGMPLQDVQELVGHTNINTTRKYYRNNIENIKYSYRKAI